VFPPTICKFEYARQHAAISLPQLQLSWCQLTVYKFEYNRQRAGLTSLQCRRLATYFLQVRIYTSAHYTITMLIINVGYLHTTYLNEYVSDLHQHDRRNSHNHHRSHTICKFKCASAACSYIIATTLVVIAIVNLPTGSSKIRVSSLFIHHCHHPTLFRVAYLLPTRH